MGHYTEITFEGDVKEEYLQLWKDRLNHAEWYNLGCRYPEFTFLHDFCRETDRAEFIPFGFNCVADCDASYSLEGRRLKFTCSLKNYEKEIEKFMSMFGQCFSGAKLITRIESGYTETWMLYWIHDSCNWLQTKPKQESDDYTGV